LAVHHKRWSPNSDFCIPPRAPLPSHNEACERCQFSDHSAGARRSRQHGGFAFLGKYHLTVLYVPALERDCSIFQENVYALLSYLHHAFDVMMIQLKFIVVDERFGRSLTRIMMTLPR